MRLADANVLLYAVNVDSTQHEASLTWLEGGLTGGDSVGLAWNALLAFVRLSTNSAILPTPLPVGDAMDQVQAWLSAPGGHVLVPGADHARLLQSLLNRTGRGGNLVNDAHLAALALEHRAEIVTYDRDFERFDGIRCRRPAELI